MKNFSFRAWLLLVVGGFVVTGCASYRYKADYGGFQQAYAENSNRQLLLNLARLDQHEPTYFLQFGQISVQYNWNSTLTALAGESTPSLRKSPLLIGQGTLAGTASEQPQFTFIPVTDERVAQQLLQPIDPIILYTLFQQGWPVDQLMRLMVDRIEVPGKGGSIITYFNTPQPTDSRRQNNLYPPFLKACAIARELQKDGHLLLEANKVFTPAVQGVLQDSPPQMKDIISLEAQNNPKGAGGDKGSGSSDEGGGGDSSTKLVWGQVGNKWSVGTYELNPVFRLDVNSDQTFNRLLGEPGYSGETLDTMKKILGQGFSVQGRAFTAQQAATNPHLLLRSFLGVLAASALEQTTFDNYVLNNPATKANVPEIELQPIIRLKWPSNQPLLTPVVDLTYRGNYYQVTDPDSTKLDERASWNRDVFRLMVQLSSQVSIDISKYPLPTTLQVSP